MPANTRFPVTGCIQDYSWCSVVVGNVTGWASAPYLVTDAGGKPTNLQVSGAQLGIPIVAPTPGAVVVGRSRRSVPWSRSHPRSAWWSQSSGRPEVLSYVTQQAVEPVLVNGEVMVGAVLPAAVPVYSVPASPYVYSYVNGQRVLVEPVSKEDRLHLLRQRPSRLFCGGRGHPVVIFARSHGSANSIFHVDRAAIHRSYRDPEGSARGERLERPRSGEGVARLYAGQPLAQSCRVRHWSRGDRSLPDAQMGEGAGLSPDQGAVDLRRRSHRGPFRLRMA